MTTPDLLSINNVAEKLELSVHQLRRWELMFGLEIKRGRGQQRQYRAEDMSVLERIKELVDQGWPTSQIRPQLEAEGLLTPKLIGMPVAPGNPEVLQESIIGLRNFTERRFIELSKQVDELRQLLISITLKQELSTDKTSPWQPMAPEYVPTPKAQPAQEITIGPQISIDPPGKISNQPYTPRPIIGAPSQSSSYAGNSGASSVYSSPSAPSGGTIIGASPTQTDSIYNSRAADVEPRNESATADSGVSMSSMVRHSTIPPMPTRTEQAPTSDTQTSDSLPATPAAATPEAARAVEPAASAVELDAVFGASSQAAGSPTQDFAPAAQASPGDAAITHPPATESASATAEPLSTPMAQPGASAFAVAKGLSQNLSESEASSQSHAPSAPSASSTPPAPSSQAAEEAESEVESGDEEESDQTVTGDHQAASQSGVYDKLQAHPAIAEDFASPPAPPPALPVASGPQVNFGPNVSAPQVTAQKVDDNFGLGEVTDQNYLTVLGRALDLIGWTDEQADSYSLKAFSVPHWDELGRSQAEKLVAHLVGLLKEQLGN